MTAMHPWIAELRGRGVRDVAIAYEVGCNLDALDALEPTDAQLAILSDLRRFGAGPWHDGPSIETRKPFRVRIAYLKGGGMLIEWAATNRAARQSASDDIPARLALLCGDPDDVDVEFRIVTASTGPRTLAEWNRRWAEAGRDYGHSILDVIVGSIVMTTYRQDSAALMRRGNVTAYVDRSRGQRLWPSP